MSLIVQQRSSAGSVSIQDFPDELLLEIFQHIPFLSSYALKQTCRRWYRIASDPILTNQLIDLPHLFPSLASVSKIEQLQFCSSTSNLNKVDFLKFMYSRCPIADDGRLIKDTHTVLFLPKGTSLYKLRRLWRNEFPPKKSQLNLPCSIFDRYGLKECECNTVIALTNDEFKEDDPHIPPDYVPIDFLTSAILIFAKKLGGINNSSAASLDQGGFYCTNGSSKKIFWMIFPHLCMDTFNIFRHSEKKPVMWMRKFCLDFK